MSRKGQSQAAAQEEAVHITLASTPLCLWPLPLLSTAQAPLPTVTEKDRAKIEKKMAKEEAANRAAFEAHKVWGVWEGVGGVGRCGVHEGRDIESGEDCARHLPGGGDE